MAFNIGLVGKSDSIKKLIDYDDEVNIRYYNSMFEYLKYFNENTDNLLLLNMDVDDIDYKDFIKEIRDNRNLPIILLSNNDKIKKAEKLLTYGYSDIISTEENKNIIKTKINQSIKDILNGFKLNTENIEDFFFLSRLMYSDKKTKETISTLKKISQSELNILISGESGLGKELFARTIHYNSRRKNNPFVVVNCSLLEDGNLQRTLFGYFDKEKNKLIPGKIQLADGGTLFFDQIDEINIEIQSKILRSIENKEVEPVGSNSIIKVDCRIISTTSKNLQEEVVAKKFNNNLLFVVNGYNLQIAPLRERKNDITLLVKNFIQYFNKTENKNILDISNKAINLLLNYNWPGNIRELKNAIYRAIYLCETDILEVKDFGFIKNLVKTISKETLDISLFDKNSKVKTMKEIELEAIQKVISYTKGNISEASKLLDLGRATFYRKLKELNLETN